MRFWSKFIHVKAIYSSALIFNESWYLEFPGRDAVVVTDVSKPLRSFETLETAQPTTQCQIAENLNPQIHGRNSLKSLHNLLGHLSGFNKTR